MIEGPSNEIDVSRLKALVQNGVIEGRTLEYKRELSVRSDEGKGDAASHSLRICERRRRRPDHRSGCR